MAEYPDWVLAHKKKGTYINYQNGKYYLYAAHSERVPGTNKVKRVSDGYLGRITEADGFIPARGKLQGEIRAYEYGLSEAVMVLCPKVRNGLGREFRANADFVFAGGALLFMHGAIRREFYETSWLSVKMPGLDMSRPPTEKQRTGIERTQKMIEDILKRHFGDSYNLAVSLLPLVRAVRIGKEQALAVVPCSVRALLEQHGLHFEEV